MMKMFPSLVSDTNDMEPREEQTVANKLVRGPGEVCRSVLNEDNIGRVGSMKGLHLFVYSVFCKVQRWSSNNYQNNYSRGTGKICQQGILMSTSFSMLSYNIEYYRSLETS